MQIKDWRENNENPSNRNSRLYRLSLVPRIFFKKTNNMIDIETIKSQIVKALMPLEPEKIILFGSYAYGTPTEDSDLDICITQKSISSKIKEKSTIRKALKNIKISKDILLETTQYFLSHSDEKWINTALYDARHKGIVLYEQR